MKERYTIELVAAPDIGAPNRSNGCGRLNALGARLGYVHRAKVLRCA
jgi:hypothetical protein